MSVLSRPCCVLSMVGRNAFLACLGLLYFFFGLSPAALGAQSNPLSSIITAQQAIEQADADLFYQAVDVDAVLNKAFGALSATLREQLAAGKIKDESGAMFFLLGSAAENSAQEGFLRQLIASEMKSFVLAGVNGGYFAGTPNGRVKADSGALASILPKLSQGRKELVPGKVLAQNNGKATVSATLIDAEAGRFPLILTVERNKENWRVTEIANVAQLLDEATTRGR